MPKQPAEIDPLENDLKIGLKSSQIAVSIVLITVLAALGFSALRNAEARDRETAFLTQVEITTGFILDAQQEVVLLAEEINHALNTGDAGKTSEQVQSTDEAIKSIATVDSNAQQSIAPSFFTALNDVRNIQTLDTASRNKLIIARSTMITDSRLWLNRYQTAAVSTLRELSAVRANNERNQAALLLLTLIMSVWLLTWIAISVGKSYRRARKIITDEESKVASARSALQHASDQLNYQANHDSLTGLPNRNALNIELSEALATNEKSVAVLFCDLDRFKVVNDSLGHSLGDDLLIEAAQRIIKAVKEADFVCRFGGDEFVIVSRNIDNQEAAIRLAERIVRSLAKPFDIRGEDAFIGASVGISISEPDATASQLLANADAAMYRAKVSTSHVQVYEKDGTKFSARFDTENALRKAIENKELLVHWQPIVNLKNGQVHTLEALMRWDRPGSGLLRPSDFMGIAEDTGLIVDIGKWVIASACATGALTDDRSVAVNVSARQLRDVNFVDDLRDILRDTGLAPERLILEVTEHTVIDPKVVNAPLQRVHELGVRIALDDFGTGYSSLSLLDQLPVDIVKLDRSFLKNLIESQAAQAVVKSLVQLTSALGMTLIVEGVESDVQRRLLRSLGVQHGQGFWFGQPEPGRLLRSRASE
jgi:diguanylate cyclase (GGDEF)-like protein